MTTTSVPGQITWVKRIIYFQLALLGVLFVYVISLAIMQPAGGWPADINASFWQGFNRGFLERVTGETTDNPIIFESYDAGYLLGPTFLFISLKIGALIALRKRMKKTTVGLIITNMVFSLGSFSIGGFILEGIQLFLVLHAKSKEYFVKKLEK